MKTIKLFSILIAIAFIFHFSIVKDADSTPLTGLELQSLNRDGANYNPPAAATFPDGPTSVLSGNSVPLYAGPTPGQEEIDYLLFLLSYDPTQATQGTGSEITFVLNGLITGSSTFDLGLVGDGGSFLTTSEAGFPGSPSEGGLNNGEIFGVNFYDTIHAGFMIPFIPPGPWPEGTLISNVTITSPVWPLRVDIFSVAEQSDPLIVGRTANSGSLAVVPEPATMLLLGSGLIGFAVVGRKKFFRKK